MFTPVQYVAPITVIELGIRKDVEGNSSNDPLPLHAGIKLFMK